jgi:predicted RNA-binding protein with TRAM domain
MTIFTFARRGSGGGGSSSDTAIIAAPGAYGSTSINTSQRSLFQYNGLTTSHFLGGVGIPRAGTLRNLTVETSGNARTVAVNCTVFVNGVSTGLTVQVPATNNGTFQDITNTVAVSAGDYVSFALFDNAAAGAGAFVCSIPSCEVLYS